MQSRLHVVALVPPQHAAHILRAGENNRYRIEHAQSEASLRALQVPPDVLLCPTSLGEDCLLRLYKHFQPHKTAFLLAGSLRFASRELSDIVDGLIAWPVQFLELTDILDRMQASATKRSLKIQPLNAKRLALLWARSETGRLIYTGGPGATSGEIAMLKGGIAPASWRQLYPLLHSGTLRFKRAPHVTSGSYDRAWMGQLLLNAVWERGHSAFALRCVDGVLAPLSFRLDLPLSKQTQRLLQAADGSTTVEALLHSLHIPQSAVGEDLFTLNGLALLQWQRLPTQLQKRDKTSRRRIASTKRRIDTKAAGTASHTPRLERPDTVRMWLQKAQRDLSHASPESILGISAEASDEMLRTAEHRLLDRYDGILRASNVPADVEEMATALRALTTTAAARIRQRGTYTLSSSTETSYRSGQQMTREEDLLARGNRLLEAQDWAQADHLLSEAVRISPEHPGVLTALAWARYNNAGLNKPDREGAARDLLRKAIDLDNSYAEAHYRIARLHSDSGNTIAAHAAARRAARLEPDEARYEKLLSRL
ncbi:MAG: hypothetical protein P8R54_04355 [Myxococcota bacterium]|nr:hypothetical protein [Myxococcota bacterium]